MRAVYCVWKDANTTDSMLPRRWCAAANVRRGSTPTALLRKRSTSQASGHISGAGWCPRTSVRCRPISAIWWPWWSPSQHQSPLSVTTTGNYPGSWMRGKKPAINCWKKIVTSAHKLVHFSSSQAPLTGLAFLSLTARWCWEAASSGMWMRISWSKRNASASLAAVSVTSQLRSTLFPPPANFVALSWLLEEMIVTAVPTINQYLIYWQNASLSSRALRKYPSRLLCQVFAPVTNLALSRSELKLWMLVSKYYVMTWTQTTLTMAQHSTCKTGGYLLPDGTHLTKAATNKLVANLKLQLRHGETSAHADHRRQQHTVDDLKVAASGPHVSSPDPQPSPEHPFWRKAYSKAASHKPRRQGTRPSQGPPLRQPRPPLYPNHGNLRDHWRAPLELYPTATHGNAPVKRDNMQHRHRAHQPSVHSTNWTVPLMSIKTQRPAQPPSTRDAADTALCESVYPIFSSIC